MCISLGRSEIKRTVQEVRKGWMESFRYEEMVQLSNFWS